MLNYNYILHESIQGTVNDFCKLKDIDTKQFVEFLQNNFDWARHCEAYTMVDFDTLERCFSRLNEATERNIRYVIEGTFECNGKEKIFYYNMMLDNWSKYLVNPDQTQLANATRFWNVPKDETMEAALDAAHDKEHCAVRFEDPDYELVDITILELKKSRHGFSRISQRSWPNGKRESLSD